MPESRKAQQQQEKRNTHDGKPHEGVGTFFIIARKPQASDDPHQPERRQHPGYPVVVQPGHLCQERFDVTVPRIVARYHENGQHIDAHEGGVSQQEGTLRSEMVSRLGTRGKIAARNSQTAAATAAMKKKVVRHPT